MYKRIVTGILTFVLALSLLCGCSTFISHDEERDMQQVVAHVEAYDIGDYTTEPKDIYKLDLMEYVSNNYSSIASSVGNDIEAAYRYGVSSLVNITIIINEVDALINSGDIEWGLTEDNTVKKRVYSVIDSTLMTLRNEILAERNEEPISSEGDGSTSTSTTYPVKPAETDDEDDEDYEEIKDTEVWEPDLSRYPGLSGDNDRRSLDREAMRRFIELLKSRVKDDFRVTEDDKAAFEADDKKIEEIINTKGIEYVYPALGDTRYMGYISGDSIIQSQKITLLQEYLTDSVKVGYDEVLDSYETTLKAQKALFTEDVSLFDSAMSEGTTVLYYPNNKYFYVKHILLPFSDAQKEELTEYKNRLNVTTDAIEDFRNTLVSGIVCYPHKDGEDDLSRPMNVSEVMNEIKAKMLPLESNVRRADNMFDDLIYLYGTDPGSFGNDKGYVVKADRPEAEFQYMKEFENAANRMRKELAPGQVLYEYVVTDYGVHIMYLASVTEVGEVPLYSYTTPGKHQTYYELLEAPIASAYENAIYQKWENNALEYNYDKHSEIFEDRFSDLWK